MKKKVLHTLLVTLIATGLLGNASFADTTDRQFLIEEEFVYESVRDNNMIYDSGERIHYVFLPPSYYDSDKSYPVIYFFHGYTETANRLNVLRTTYMTLWKLET